MKTGEKLGRQAGRGERSTRLLAKAAILALLIAVAGLSTLAKNSLYYPKSHPTHYVSIASKARVAPAGAALERAPLIAVARMMPTQPMAHSAPHEQAEAPLIPKIGIGISLQNRPPPTLLL